MSKTILLVQHQSGTLTEELRDKIKAVVEQGLRDGYIIHDHHLNIQPLYLSDEHEHHDDEHDGGEHNH